MRKWTQEEKKKQAKLIHNWQPWINSTGAKTLKGKQASKMNAQKHGLYGAEFKELKKELSRYSELVS